LFRGCLYLLVVGQLTDLLGLADDHVHVVAEVVSEDALEDIEVAFPAELRGHVGVDRKAMASPDRDAPIDKLSATVSGHPFDDRGV